MIFPTQMISIRFDLKGEQFLACDRNQIMHLSIFYFYNYTAPPFTNRYLYTQFSHNYLKLYRIVRIYRHRKILSILVQSQDKENCKRICCFGVFSKSHSSQGLELILSGSQTNDLITINQYMR